MSILLRVAIVPSHLPWKNFRLGPAWISSPLSIVRPAKQMNPHFLFRVVFLRMTGAVLWPYLAGIVTLSIGAAVLFRSRQASTSWVDRFIQFGSMFFAVPMAVFGADHFIAPAIVAAMVPSWIPWHLFWTYLVGTALIAAALSIVTNKYASLAAALLSAMIFSFVLLLHVPKLAANPSDRITLAVLLRDLSFSAGALAFVAAHSLRLSGYSAHRITLALRFAIAIPALLFGIEHFLHPDFVPVVPLNQLMPTWVPAHHFVSYGTGFVLVACGSVILVNWKTRLAATSLGVFVLVIVVLIYLPMVIVKPSDIGNGLNYLVDTLAFSGTALLLAEALAPEDRRVRERDTLEVRQRRLETVA
jgi:uncharacterized membrane protein